MVEIEELDTFNLNYGQSRLIFNIKLFYFNTVACGFANKSQNCVKYDLISTSFLWFYLGMQLAKRNEPSQALVGTKSTTWPWLFKVFL